MANPSQLISLELPDDAGKTTNFYTYDGYLEENDRSRIRREFKNLQQLRISAAAVFALAGFAVFMLSIRPLVVFRYLCLAGRDAQCQLLVSSRELQQGLWAMSFSAFINGAKNLHFNVKLS